ncbi:MAG: SPFH domain-containing protein [Myxococcota bacterium]
MGRARVILEETERGLLFRDGRLVRWLGPGRSSFWAWRAKFRVQRVDVTTGWIASTPELEAIVPEGAAEVVIVKANQVAFVTIDGTPTAFLEAGRYLLWQLRAEVRAWVVDTDDPVADLSERFARLVPAAQLVTYTVHQDQAAVLMVDGRASAWLDAGRHYVWSRGRAVSLSFVHLSTGYHALSDAAHVRDLAPESSYEELTVPQGSVAIVSLDDVAHTALGAGRYLLWQEPRRATSRVVAMSALFTTLPESTWALLTPHYLRVVTVRPYERGVLYVDGKLERVLESGRYGIHTLDREVDVRMVDVREQELQILGQEVMTTDKVTLRVNLIVKFRIADALASVQQQADLHGSLYSEAQMAARRYIAGVDVDALLEGREEARRIMLGEVASRARDWGVEVLQIDLKDVILPGEMKTLLNRVIEAQKAADANVIMRREETAATRSQANTARMLAENPTLMRLKEMEMVREMAKEVGSLQIVAGSDELVRLIKP